MGCDLSVFVDKLKKVSRIVLRILLHGDVLHAIIITNPADPDVVFF